MIKFAGFHGSKEVHATPWSMQYGHLPENPFQPPLQKIRGYISEWIVARCAITTKKYSFTDGSSRIKSCLTYPYRGFPLEMLYLDKNSASKKLRKKSSFSQENFAILLKFNAFTYCWVKGCFRDWRLLEEEHPHSIYANYRNIFDPLKTEEI